MTCSHLRLTQSRFFPQLFCFFLGAMFCCRILSFSFRGVHAVVWTKIEWGYCFTVEKNCSLFFISAPNLFYSIITKYLEWQEDFNSWNYWKMPLPDIEDELSVKRLITFSYFSVRTLVWTNKWSEFEIAFFSNFCLLTGNEIFLLCKNWSGVLLLNLCV